MMFRTNALPVLGLMSGCENAEKSPTRCAGVGTNTFEKNTAGASPTSAFEKTSFGELGKGIETKAGKSAALVYPRTSMFPLESLAV